MGQGEFWRIRRPLSLPCSLILETFFVPPFYPSAPKCGCWKAFIMLSKEHFGFLNASYHFHTLVWTIRKKKKTTMFHFYIWRFCTCQFCWPPICFQEYTKEDIRGLFFCFCFFLSEASYGLTLRWELSLLIKSSLAALTYPYLNPRCILVYQLLFACFLFLLMERI